MAHRAGALSRGPPGPAHAPVGDEGLGLRLAWTTLGLGRRVGQVRELSMPDGVRDLHRQLVRELAPAVLGKALPRDAPCLIAVLADDHPNSHARTDALVGSDLLLGRFRVLDGYSANRLRRRQPRVRRARHEDSRK